MYQKCALLRIEKIYSSIFPRLPYLSDLVANVTGEINGYRYTDPKPTLSLLTDKFSSERSLSKHLCTKVCDFPVRLIDYLIF